MKLLQPHQHLAAKPRLSVRQLGLIGLLVAITGITVVLSIAAAGTPIAFEPETGILAAGATTTTVTGQSGTGAVKFAAAATPTPTPVPSGYPSAANTGPAAAGYTNLAPHAGNWTIATSGTYTGYNVSGTVTITANNVILQGCDIHGATGGNLVTVTGNNVQILDCVIHGDGPTTAQAPENSWLQIYGDATTVKRCNFYYSSGDGIRRDGTNFTMEDSYVHDWVQSPTNDPHIDGVTEGSDGTTSGVTLRHNTILMWSNVGLTNVVSFAAGPGNVLTNVIVDNNLLAGGGFIFHGGGDANYSNMTFTSNKISTMFTPDGGDYGVMRNAPAWGTKGTSWTNNTWYDGAKAGQQIAAP